MFSYLSHIFMAQSALKTEPARPLLLHLRMYAAALLTILICLFPALSYADVGKGYLEEARYDSSTQALTLHGWAAPEFPNVYTSNILVSLGKKQIYKGSFLRSERSDVVIATGRTDWLWSGWQLEVKVPPLPAGEKDLQVEFLLTDGQLLEIKSLDSARSISIPFVPSPSTRYLVFLAFAVIIPVLVFLFAEPIKIWKNCPRVEVLFALAVLFSFISLVASGFSGSSVRLALKDSPILVHDAVAWQGDARFIRSDEWNILTQMAIGQLNAEKKFPVLNSNVGIDGNNMLIIGMTGVPVSHISSLAKPATWGFWLFDMRRALAWHWWLPFFGCFLALWVLIIRFFRLNWRIASLIALSVTASPYSLVFSGHPAYVVFFLTLSISLLDIILKTSQAVTAIACGLILGLSLAGFILVLYLPWQITLIYLMLPVAVVYWISCRHSLLFRRNQIVSLTIALVVFLFLIAAWLVDAQDALRIAAATVYPGQRSTSVGGDIDPWFLIKGLMNPLTLYQETSMLSASAAGSFIWIWIPLIFIAALVCLNDRRIYAIPIVISGFIFMALVYIHFGFLKPIADITVWGRVTSHRLDLALGVAQCLLLSWLLSVKSSALHQINNRTLNILACGVAGVCFVLAIWQFGWLPLQILRVLTPGFTVIASFLFALLAYLIVMRKYEWAVGIYCAWMIGAACMFNPLDQAPNRLSLSPVLKSALDSDAILGVKPRLAVMDNYLWTMSLIAGGIPLVNAVLYYPQASLWGVLDPGGIYKKQYNRYQNLEFITREMPMGQDFQIDSQRLDMVRVTVDPTRFDFKKLGATHILTLPEKAPQLLFNTTIREVAATNEWALFKVVSP